MKKYSSLLIIIICAFIGLQSCGIGGYHVGIWKTEFPYSGKFTNTAGINLAYRIRFPYAELNEPVKLPLLLYVDGSGPFPLGVHVDSLLSHFQSRGFVAAASQKRGVNPSAGDFSKLTFEERINDNLDFINYLLQKYSEIDANQIYIMGHSEGAAIAGTVACRYQKPAGLIWASACLDEDFFDYIHSFHSGRDHKLMEEIRNGKDLSGKWQYYSKIWWNQHFNHTHIPELMKLSCPVIFLSGDEDEQFPFMQKRYEELIAKGKKNISFYTIRSVGHGTVAPLYQESLLSVIDKWLESIKK